VTLLLSRFGYTGDDVVLVDTAGRMQDNAPLMQALAQLIQVNKPDLVRILCITGSREPSLARSFVASQVLFVGEALVGNDAVDQLVKFNRALVDHSKDTNPQTVDGRSSAEIQRCPVLATGATSTGGVVLVLRLGFQVILSDLDSLDSPPLTCVLVCLGIILTKFDTIDDKVGAAISMTHTTGQPIVFVGCGQDCTYQVTP